MICYALAHLSDEALSHNLQVAVAQDRLSTAAVLAHIAEFDARHLFLPAGYPSMHAYCVQALHYSEAAANKRIQAARSARSFPAIFEAVADGRLHLSAVIVLGPSLTPGNVGDLIAAAEHKTKAQIEELVAARSPRTEAMPMVLAVPTTTELAPGRVEVASRFELPAKSVPVAAQVWGVLKAPALQGLDKSTVHSG